MVSSPAEHETAAIVTKALQLIREQHRHDQLNSHAISEQLGLSDHQLDRAFLACRGRSCEDTISSFRLSRLFDRIQHNPSVPLPLQVKACGFRSVEAGDEAFRSQFGISLEQFQHISCRAEQDRVFRRDHPSQSLVLSAA